MCACAVCVCAADRGQAAVPQPPARGAGAPGSPGPWKTASVHTGLMCATEMRTFSVFDDEHRFSGL